jgi:hypothetical protein
MTKRDKTTQLFDHLHAEYIHAGLDPDRWPAWEAKIRDVPPEQLASVLVLMAGIQKADKIKEALTAARELLEAEWPSARMQLIDHAQLATVRGLAEEADKLMNALDLIVVDWRWLSRKI